MDPMTALGHLRAAIGDVRGVIADGDLAAGVPACPGWTVPDLARHLGELHRWVRCAIVQGHPHVEVPPPPAGRAGLLAWYDEGAGVLLDLLGRSDPDTPCWAFGPKPSTARFWFRRQAHEHAVHAVDALASQGRPRPLDPLLAADGIDEVVRMFFPRQVRLGRTGPLDRSLAVVPVDLAGAARVLAGDGTGDVAPEAAEATVTGPSELLDLLLWGRVRLDDARLAVTGDPSAARAVLGAAIVP